MSAVSVREFSYNPSAMFARVEQNQIRLKATTTSDLDRITRHPAPPSVSALDILLADREADER